MPWAGINQAFAASGQAWAVAGRVPEAVTPAGPRPVPVSASPYATAAAPASSTRSPWPDPLQMRPSRLQQREEEMRARQEELRRRREVEEAKRKQQKAALVVRKVIQRMRAATVDNIDELRTELESVQLEQLEEMGEEASKVREEAEKALDQVQKRLEAKIREREEQERKRLEDEAKKREEQEWIATLAKVASDEVEAAESKVARAEGAAAPLCEGVQEASPDSMLAAAEATDEAADAARLGAEEARRIVAEKREEMGHTPEAMKVKNGPEFRGFMERLKACVKSADELSAKAKVAKEKAKRLAAAEKKTREHREMFDKYNISSDGLLSRKEALIFALEEYGLELNDEQLGKIISKLASGGIGVPFAKFQQLRSMVAIERSVVKAREKERAVKEEEERSAREQADWLEEVRTATTKAREVLNAAEVASTKAQQAAKKITPPLADNLSAEQMRLAAKEVVTEAAPAAEALQLGEASLELLGVPKGVANAKVNRYWQQQLSELKMKATRLQVGLMKLMDTSTEALSRAARTEIAGMERLRLQLVHVVLRVVQAEGKTAEQLFAEAGGSCEGFIAFVRSVLRRCPDEEQMPSLCAGALEDVQLERLFQHVSGGHESISEGRFLALLARLVYRVTKDGVLAHDEDPRSSVLRRLKVGEVVEGLEMEKTVEGVKRVRCRTVNDNQEGWTTISGSHGTVFLQARGVFYTCVAETVMTESISVADSRTIRKLKRGEVVEATELERKDESSGALRVKCTAKRDGKTGWVTLIGNKDTAFLEPV
mmetsp:Transcript_81434/g.263765  ORF Transcript_81434/g.263765 Transcript_81434/m.263765 type:complete len:775 (-) Transcript_81434:67-2391(-)